MTNYMDVVETFALLYGCVWLGYKSYKKKEERHLLSAFILLAILISRWPIHAPTTVSFGLSGFIAAGFLVYDRLFKTKEKNILWVYAFLFVIFAIYFFADFAFFGKNTVLVR